MLLAVCVLLAALFAWRRLTLRRPATALHHLMCSTGINDVTDEEQRLLTSDVNGSPAAAADDAEARSQAAIRPNRLISLHTDNCLRTSVSRSTVSLVLSHCVSNNRTPVTCSNNSNKSNPILIFVGTKPRHLIFTC